MRFGRVHRFMTDALATLGLLAVISTGTLATPMAIAALIGLFVAILLPEALSRQPAWRTAAAAAPVALFIIQAVRLLFGHPPLEVAVEFATFLQIVRLGTRRGAAHDQQIIVLALLHLVAGTVLGGGLAYGLCFLGFLLFAPGALVLSHLRREVEGNYRQGARDRTGLPVDVPRILRSRRVVGKGFLLSTSLLAVPIFLFTATLFVLFPRVGLSLLLLNHPRSGRMVGFSDHVDLGAVGVLRTDPSLALRFEVEPPVNPPPAKMTFRLRGTAFDRYDGRAWARTRLPAPAVAAPTVEPHVYTLGRAPDPSHDRYLKVDLEPIDPPVVFLPPNAVAVRVRPHGEALLSDPLRLVHGAEGEVRYTGTDSHGLSYDVFLAGDDEIFTEPLPPLQRPRYLTLPPNLPDRLADLAHRWTDPEPTQRRKALAIAERLQKDYRYDLGSPSSGTHQPVDHFLFTSKRGHCEFFSTSMALMLRAIGIPSRNVTGFVGGTYNRFGHYYAVRQGDAHSWVEAYIDDIPNPGWQTFDPTPAAGAQPLAPNTGLAVFLRDVFEAMSQRWNHYVVGYDLKRQLALFESARDSYASARRRAGLDHGLAGAATRPSVVAIGALIVVAGAYALWRRRRRRKKAPRTDPAPTHAAAVRAARLYQELERAMNHHGITRPPAVPPERHAKRLVSEGHPFAEAIFDLTRIYQTARFSESELAPSDAEGFLRRVRELKDMPLVSGDGPGTEATPSNPSVAHDTDSA